MKKSLFIMFVAVSALLVCLVACKPGPSTPVETGEDGFIHVSTWAEFEQGLVDAKSTDKKTVILDKNLTFDSTTYTSSTPYGQNVTGLTIDLGGYKINGVNSCAFRLFGDFTIKNGTITGSGDSYGLLINSNNTTSGVDYNPETRENHAVTVQNLKLVDCGIRAELSTITVSNCEIQNSGTSGNSNALYFVGAVATITGGKLSQTATAVETISRTDCVYCSGKSTVHVSGVTLEGTKRMNAYSNTVEFTVTNCAGAVTTTPTVVTIN